MSTPSSSVERGGGEDSVCTATSNRIGSKIPFECHVSENVLEACTVEYLYLPNSKFGSVHF